MSDGDTNYARNISQTIDNLVQGEQYEVSFYQAAGQQTNFYGGTTEQWNVTFGNTTKTSALISPVQPHDPGEDTFDGQGQQVTGGTATAVSSWQKETMIFTAVRCVSLIDLASATGNYFYPVRKALHPAETADLPT